MNDYCFIGGGKILDEKMEGIRIKIKEIILTNQFQVGCAVIIPSSQKDKWIDISRTFFLELSLSQTYIFDPENKYKKIKDIHDADVVFFTGGFPDQFLMNSYIKKTKKSLRNALLNKKKLIIGISAGALVLNEICFISKDKDYTDNLVLEGLNLRNDFVCEVHYSGQIKLIQETIQDKKIIAVEDYSAYITENTKELCVGNVHFYRY